MISYYEINNLNSYKENATEHVNLLIYNVVQKLNEHD